MRIVILEDDQEQADLLKAWIQEAGYQCIIYNNGNAFTRGYAKESFDLVLLDWMVPNTTGIEILQYLRQHLGSDVPVIFITQKDTEENIVKALESGADDYMTKPVRQFETMARIRAVARRLGLGDENTAEVYEYQPYTINTKKRQILLHDKLIEMTQKEYDLALFLFKNLGRVISRGHLLELVWGTSSNLNTRTVDTHVSRLRSKLHLDDQENWKLTSVYRHGYRLEMLE